MKPIPFEKSNITFAKDQKEYQPLPAYKDKDGKVITCWSLSFKERLKVLFSGKIYVNQLTFKKPLQPILVTIDFIE